MLSFMPESEIISYPPKFIPNNFIISNYVKAIQQSPLIRLIVNSFVIAFVGSVIRLAIASLAAYPLALFNFKGKKFMFMFILGTIMLPGDAMIITNYLTISKFGLINTYEGVMLVYFLSATYIFMLRQYFKTISVSLKEASEIDGCNNFLFFVKILLPLSKPILASLFISSFVGLWNIYLWPLLLTNTPEMRTVQVGITMLNFPEASSYGPLMAGTVLILIPTIFIFVFFQKKLISGITSGSIVN
jgi:sn-glycerol 3-phosphate transport system permease protein